MTTQADILAEYRRREADTGGFSMADPERCEEETALALGVTVEAVRDALREDAIRFMRAG